MKTFLIAFLALSAGVLAQNNLGRPAPVDTSLTEVRPPLHFNLTVDGLAFIAAYSDFISNLNNYVATTPSFYFGKLKTLVATWGKAHINNFAQLGKSVQVYKGFFSRVRNADFMYKSRYANLTADLQLRTTNSPVNATFAALQPSIQTALKLVANLSALNTSIFQNQQALNKTANDFRVQADALLNNVSNVIYMQNRDQASELAAIITDARALNQDKKSQLREQMGNFKTKVNTFTSSLTSYDSAITSYLNSVYAEKAAALNTLKGAIDSLKSSLDADKSSQTAAFNANFTALQSSFTSSDDKWTGEMGNELLSETAINLATVKANGFKMLAQLKSGFAHTQYSAQVLGYLNKFVKWAAQKNDFDLNNLFNFQTAYTNQINQVFANYESLGLYTSQLARQINSALTTYSRVVISRPFRLGDWTPVSAATVPATIAVANLADLQYFKVLIAPFTTAFPNTNKNWRVHVKNDDKSMSFMLVDGFESGTDGVWCYIGTNDPMMAMDDVTCTIQIATTPSGLITELGSAQAPTANSAISVPLLFTETPAL